MKRILTLAVLSGLLFATCPTDVQAHVYKKVKPSDCVFNWKSPGGNEKQIRCFAAKFGVSPDFAVSVARCESGLNWNPGNRTYSSSAGGYFGTWQYLASTWESSKTHYFPGRAGATPLHARYATITTMRKVVHEGWGAWACA